MTATTASTMWARCHVSYRMPSSARHRAVTTSAISENSATNAKTAPHGTSSREPGSTNRSGRAANMISACAPTSPTAISEIWR